jgi:hypothetical protein
MKVPGGNPNAPRASASGGGRRHVRLTAALAADAGYEVLLVENAKRARRLDGAAVEARALRASPMPSRRHRRGDALAQVMAPSAHHVHLARPLAETAGAPGRFK